MSIKVIAQDTVKAQYDMWCKWAIIDHPKHGRLYITQGFGGMDSLQGGMYRWSNGIAVQLMPDDTITSLSAMHNETINILEAACRGYRDERQLVDWTGDMVAQVAKSCGL